MEVEDLEDLEDFEDDYWGEELETLKRQLTACFQIGNTQLVEELVANNLHIITQENTYCVDSIFYAACEKGNVKEAKKILKGLEDVDLSAHLFLLIIKTELLRL